MKINHPIYTNYSADREGNFYNGGRLLMGADTSDGYRQHGVGGKCKLAHRLISECFLGRELESTQGMCL